VFIEIPTKRFPAVFVRDALKPNGRKQRPRYSPLKLRAVVPADYERFPNGFHVVLKQPAHTDRTEVA